MSVLFCVKDKICIVMSEIQLNYEFSLTWLYIYLLESFVGSWILDRIEDKFDKHQYGALKGRSMHDARYIMHHWHKAVDEDKSVRVVFVDFAKAFNHIDHNVLVTKLMNCDLPHTVIRWICSFLIAPSASASQDWWRDVWMAGDGCWHASRIVSRATDVHHSGR